MNENSVEKTVRAAVTAAATLCDKTAPGSDPALTAWAQLSDLRNILATDAEKVLRARWENAPATRLAAQNAALGELAAMIAGDWPHAPIAKVRDCIVRYTVLAVRELIVGAKSSKTADRTMALRSAEHIATRICDLARWIRDRCAATRS